MTDLEALNTLLGGYLNEDLFDEYGSAWDAVEAFVRHEPDHAAALAFDIRSFITPEGPEGELEHRLYRMGLGYLPTADGWQSHRQWLLAVADRVDELLRGQASERAD